MFAMKCYADIFSFIMANSWQFEYVTSGQNSWAITPHCDMESWAKKSWRSQVEFTLTLSILLCDPERLVETNFSLVFLSRLDVIPLLASPPLTLLSKYPDNILASILHDLRHLFHYALLVCKKKRVNTLCTNLKLEDVATLYHIFKWRIYVDCGRFLLMSPGSHGNNFRIST